MSEAAAILDQEMTAEAPVEGTAPEAAKPEDRMSPKLDILIKREQQAVMRERAAKQKELEIDQKMQELEAKLSRYSEFESVKEKPKKALELLGLDYDQLTQSMLNEGDITPEIRIKKLEEKWEQKWKQDSDERQRQKEAQELQQKEALKAKESEFKSEIKDYIQENKDRYELIAFEDADELVYDIIDEHYNRTINEETGIGKIMPIADAADRVEKHLEAKYNKSKELNKVKSLWNIVPKEMKNKLVEQIKSQTQEPRQKTTLTNQLSSTASVPTKKLLTDQERIQKAISYARERGFTR